MSYIGEEGTTGTVFNVLSEMVNKGVNIYKTQEEEGKKKEAEKKSAIDVDMRTRQSIAADAAWAGAEANLDLAVNSPVKDAQRISAAQVLVQSAKSKALSVGSGLPSTATQKRIDTVQSSAQRAAEESFSAPQDMAKAAKMRAWQKVSSAVSDLSLSPVIKQSYGGGSSFLSQSYKGIPMWGWGLGGAAVLVGGIMFIKSMKKRK